MLIWLNEYYTAYEKKRSVSLVFYFVKYGGTKWRTSWRADTRKKTWQKIDIFGISEWMDGSWLYRSYIYIYIYGFYNFIHVCIQIPHITLIKCVLTDPHHHIEKDILSRIKRSPEELYLDDEYVLVSENKGIF